jgi:hypothetical protein
MVEKLRMRSAIDFGEPGGEMPSRAGLITPICAHPKFIDRFVDLSAILHLRLLAEIVGKELFVVDVLFGKLQHRC